MSENPILRLTCAYRFAAQAHVDEKRKGERGEPYINHLVEVADMVARATDGSDVDLVVAALLHDTVEDTKVTAEDLSREFGARVASLVAEVTDDKSLPQAERKRLQVEHAPHLSRDAQIIKLADKTSNVRDIIASPPKGWSAERRADYVAWARQVVDICRPASPMLSALFDEAVGRAPSRKD
ncbi:MAG TPA: HD domain-containing protein [Caulobacteraceae bacterium]|jgi:(p)ppGpp synthase/HD superfamily hydrolase